MPKKSETPLNRLGPYRTPSPPGALRRPRKLPWIIVGVTAVALLSAVAWYRSRPARPGIDEVPKDLLHHISSYPPPEPQLPPATPLAPLLVADQPEALAVLGPDEGATRLRRGQTLRIRFNRPMVAGRDVGGELSEMDEMDELPVVFDPPITGRAQWTSRATLQFTPAPEAWSSSSRESRLYWAAGLASLDGEGLEDDLERVIVLDGAPRAVAHLSSGRVNAGAPLPLYFDAPIGTNMLNGEVLAYEIGGAHRSLPLQLVARGEDRDGRFRVDVVPRRDLEPGSHIGLALTPRFTEYGGRRPAVFEYEITPRPHIEGIDCTAEAYEASHCDFTSAPGRIIDIGPALRLLSSAPLGDIETAQLRITPPLAEMRVELNARSGDPRLLTIEGEWEPDQVYEVRLARLQTTAGEPVRPPPPLAVRSAGHSPALRVDTGRLTYEADARAVIHFSAVNTDRGQVLYRPVERGQELEAALELLGFLGAGRTALPLSPLAPEARPNRWGQGELLWRDGSSRNADMAVVGFWPTVELPRSAISTAFVQATDLGVTLRGSREDLLVWVTSLSDGHPVDNAAVSVVNLDHVEVGRGRTDGDGIATLHLSETPLRDPHAVLVVSGDDRAVTVLDPRRAVAPYGMGLTPGARATVGDAATASIFTDRGAYRPEETIRAKLVVRQVDGATATALRRGEITAKLFSPTDTAPVDEVELHLNRWGTAQVEFDLSGTAGLGRYVIEVFHDRGEESIGSATIRVAEFRQPTFRVDLALPEAVLHEGDRLPFTASATYLFGAPVAEGELHWSIVRQGGAPYPDRWDRYRFTSIESSRPSGTVTADDSELDGDGRIDLQAQLTLGTPRRGRLGLEAEITDSAGHTYAARRTFVVYPAAFEVGLRRGADWVELGEELDLDAIVINHDGEFAAGRTVTARIIREGWHGWWEWSDHATGPGPQHSEGYRLRRNRRREEVHGCELTSETAAVHCLFTPTRPGTYVLEVTTRDDAGRASVASRRVYVAGPEDHPDRDPPGSRIAVTPTRRRWNVGETAELAFESPWPGAQALITVEREGVIHSERREVGAGGQVVRVPLTGEMVPNAFVGVTLVRPRTGPPEQDVDLSSPDLRFGVAELTVQPETSRLDVAIDVPANEARSGTELPITLRVTDADGRPVRAEVALFAVDEGTLRLTDYQVPDPTAGVFRRRAADFAWEDLRRALVSRLQPPPEPRAGGGGGSGPGGDSASPPPQGERFDPTPLWLPQLETDAAGRVSATLTLPHRETEYRVMAVALDDGIRWGNASTSVVATQPVVVRPAFPRFLRVGDTFDANVFVHNTTDAPLRARVVATVNGEARPARVVEIAPGADQRVAERINVTGSDRQSLELRFEVTGGDYRAATEETIPVRPAGRWVRSQVVATVGERPLPLTLPEGVSPLGGRVTLTVASHPFLGFDGAVASLEESHWGGTEPLAARVLGLAAYSELGLDARPGTLSAEELRARGNRAVKQLAALQNYEDGFSRWDANSYSRPHETTFALHALQRAKRAGFEIPDNLIEGTRNYLAGQTLSSHFGDEYGRHAPDELAFALRVLSEGDVRQADRASAVYDQRERLTPFGMAQLAMALGDDESRSATLVHDAALRVLADRDDEARNPSRLRWYDHSARVYGAVLEAAVQSDVGRRHTQRLARRLLQLRRGDRAYPWSTTLETARALSALSAYARLFQLPEAIDPEVRLDRQALTIAGQSHDSRWYDVPFAELLSGGGNSLRIESDDEAPLFFAIDGRWAVPLGEADETARGRVVALHRTFETPEGRPIADGDDIELGSMVRVRLFVYAEHQPPPLVALRDGIAAGFEAVDSDLHSSPRESLLSLFGMAPDDEAVDARSHLAMRTHGNISHRTFDTGSTSFYFEQLGQGLSELTYAVRATTVGEFTVPPAQLEALYTPAFIGRSTATTLTVIANE